MTARSPGEAWRRLCDLRVRLRDRCEQTLRLEALGGELGLSASRFLRRFRAVFGATPHALQGEARLARACALLRESTLPVTEVCLEVGYRSLGSFSWAFSRRMGCSPRDFRARANGRQGPESPHDCFARMG
ncbi:MAG TPA: helix-turn-helix transcriptional regulator [Myxococcaceae bacterium]|jgi:AraC-like DNA-binding protein